jgi:serine phosphatase RsbU (regulator of sigma subunit)
MPHRCILPLFIFHNGGFGLEVRIGIAKTNKYAVSECGDSVEIAERPKGGISAILADGQGHGRAAKAVSAMVVNKAASLIAEGARDGAVARAVHDYLYVMKDGRVSATLTILSADFDTQTFLFSRNSNCPVVLKQSFGFTTYDEGVNPIGVHKNMKPLLVQLPLEEGMIAVTFSDGISAAGKKKGREFEVSSIEQLLEDSRPEDAQFIAETILENALTLDDERAGDDMTVVVVGIGERTQERRIQRISVVFPA